MNTVHSDYAKSKLISYTSPKGTLAWYPFCDIYVIFTGICWMSLASGTTYPRDTLVQIMPAGTFVTITVG